MGSEQPVVDDVTHAGGAGIGSTPRRELAKTTITKTTVSPLAPDGDVREKRQPRFDRARSSRQNESSPPVEPISGTNWLRLSISALLGVICVLNVAGSILILLLWQQNRTSGVLTSQVDRTWEIFDALREVERVVAFAAIPVALAWAVLATVNVRRATGKRPSAIVSGVGIIVGTVGVWVVGRELIGTSDSWSRQALGCLAQAACIAVPLLALERVADASEARHRPLRATCIIAAAYVAILRFLGGLSTVDQTTGADEWGQLGAYLMIGALVLVLGSLAATEATRAIEEATDHRYQLRRRFGESLLSQVDNK